MTTEQQIKALAELDGWEIGYTTTDGKVFGVFPAGNLGEQPVKEPPPYLTSYDAIIPLAAKVAPWMTVSVYETPERLSERVLRATGKWI